MCGKSRFRVMRCSYSAFRVLVLGSIILVGAGAWADDNVANLRGFDIATEQAAPVMPKPSATELRQVRNYPEQPPVIPHKIRGYQVDLNSNKCLSCHSRLAVGDSQAPMISVTHFMDRSGQVLAGVTSRRYFCNQCHVPQLDVSELIENTFVDAESVVKP